MFDLNADLGEGFGPWTMGDDDALLDIVTSANVACGFHAGDPTIMRRTCEHAVARGVRIGAHIGYRDLAGFGRRSMTVPPAEIADQTLYQIGALEAAARAAGDRVRYVKPHGALYHAAAADAAIADAVTGAMTTFDGLALLGPHGSELNRSADRHGIALFGEAFADRAYTPTGGLAPRSEPGAVLGRDDALAQALSLALDGTARVAGTVDDRVRVIAHSICVHGDSAGAVAIARAIRAALTEGGIEIGAFT